MPEAPPASSRTRVLIADDHPIVREGLRTVLSQEPEIEVVGEAATGVEALELLFRLRPHVVLMDLVMPGLSGLEVLRRIRQGAGGVRVLILTSFAQEGQVQEAIAAGALGYILKDVLKDDLLAAIRSARQGVPWLHPEAQRQLVTGIAAPAPARPWEALTPRERAVLEHVAGGKSNKEIADALGISEGTVKGYVSTILDKLGVEDRTQAALFAVRHGLAGPG
jgi:DNA-binding NarL/FixJ family response regulator